MCALCLALFSGFVSVGVGVVVVGGGGGSIGGGVSVVGVGQ